MNKWMNGWMNEWMKSVFSLVQLLLLMRNSCMIKMNLVWMHNIIGYVTENWIK